jgi:hypothetical protein
MVHCLGASKISSQDTMDHEEEDDAKVRLLTTHDQHETLQHHEPHFAPRRILFLILHLVFTLGWISAALNLYLRPSSSRSTWRSAGCGIRELEFCECRVPIASDTSCLT